ncbi:hypothetical protein GOV04_05920 [Candidatus Woesearchaeota archaeon]|nr:hypothetical protein [Candidatus Woesearchaeota archaeon]
MSNKLGVILIRSTMSLNPDIKKTLELLKLSKKNSLAIVSDTPQYRGMLQKVKDYVTYGELDETLIKSFDKQKIVGLHPPRGGFERKGIKKSFTQGGALGYRKEKINDLIKKMMK